MTIKMPLTRVILMRALQKPDTIAVKTLSPLSPEMAELLKWRYLKIIVLCRRAYFKEWYLGFRPFKTSKASTATIILFYTFSYNSGTCGNPVRLMGSSRFMKDCYSQSIINWWNSLITVHSDGNKFRQTFKKNDIKLWFYSHNTSIESPVPRSSVHVNTKCWG